MLYGSVCATVSRGKGRGEWSETRETARIRPESFYPHPSITKVKR